MYQKTCCGFLIKVYLRQFVGRLHGSVVAFFFKLFFVMCDGIIDALLLRRVYPHKKEKFGFSQWVSSTPEIFLYSHSSVLSRLPQR